MPLLLLALHVSALSNTRINCSSLIHLVQRHGQCTIICFYVHKPKTAVPRLRRLVGSL